jgi:hypothetical protein
MSTAYSDPSRESDPHALPDIWITQLTAREAAEQDEDRVWEYTRRYEFRLASMSSRIREKMFEVMIEEEKIEGGWFWCYCQVGCLPDSYFRGPFDTEEEAEADMRSEQEDMG